MAEPARTPKPRAAGRDYAVLEEPAMAAWLRPKCLRQSRCGSMARAYLVSSDAGPECMMSSFSGPSTIR